MDSRREFLGRLIEAPAGAGFGLLAMASLVGCEGQPQTEGKTQAVTRDDPKLQRDVEIPPGIPSSNEKPRGAGWPR